MTQGTREKLWNNALRRWPENNEDARDLALAYMDGADGFHKEIWHDGADLPEDKPLILVFRNGQAIITSRNRMFGMYDLVVVKWCYLNDIL